MFSLINKNDDVLLLTLDMRIVSFRIKLYEKGQLRLSKQWPHNDEWLGFLVLNDNEDYLDMVANIINRTIQIPFPVHSNAECGAIWEYLNLIIELHVLFLLLFVKSLFHWAPFSECESEIW